MQISSFNDTQNPDDQFFAFVDGVVAFSGNEDLPVPLSFSIRLFGNTSMLADDQLPTGNVDWSFGNISFDFSATDGTKRQVLMTFVPTPFLFLRSDSNGAQER